MVEIKIDCKESICCFKALSPKDQVLNEHARAAALNGEKFAGLDGTMCGSCVKEKIKTYFLDRKILQH